MALAKKILGFLLMTALFAVSLGAVYKVGDSAGWTIMGDVDFDKWASAKNFHAGDVIVFEYDKQYHDVEQVTLRDFRSCNATSPSAVYTSGSDSITLKRPGHYYFLCGHPGHCEAGQKVDILVTPSSFRSGGSPSSALHAPPPPSRSASAIAPPPIPAKNSASSLSSLSCGLLWLSLHLLLRVQ